MKEGKNKSCDLIHANRSLLKCNIEVLRPVALSIFF
jgi:hypothetical protein